jgi:hypothetical protein
MILKQVCSSEDCYQEVDLEFEIKKLDGTYHPLQLKCLSCLTAHESKTLKNWKKSYKKKINKRKNI